MPLWPTEEKTKDAVLGYTVLRVVVGVNILMHGVVRILAGPSVFAAHLVTQFQPTPLANWLVNGFGLALPWLEALLGLLLLLGLKMRWTVVASGALLAVLTYGSCMVQDWQATGAQMIYAIAYALLLILRQWNVISLDGLLEKPSEV